MEAPKGRLFEYGVLFAVGSLVQIKTIISGNEIIKNKFFERSAWYIDDYDVIYVDKKGDQI